MDSRNRLPLWIAKDVKKRARHPYRWYRRAALRGRAAAVVSLLCAFAVTGADFWLESTGSAAENGIAGILPGSAAAHLYFRFVRYIAALRGERGVVVLAALGALVAVSLHVLLGWRAIREGRMRGLALLVFFEAFTAYAAGCLPVPGAEFPLFPAAVGIALRAVLGFFLLRGHSGKLWCEWLFAADEMLWAAQKYGWGDDFDLHSLSEEEWSGIHADYTAYRGETEKESKRGHEKEGPQ